MMKEMKKMKMKITKENVKKMFNSVFILTAYFSLFGISYAFAEGQTVFTAVSTAIAEAQAEIIKWSTGMAVLGIGWGAFIKKMAGGDPQKIEKGNSAIKTSIAGWALVNGSTLIFNTIQQWIK